MELVEGQIVTSRQGRDTARAYVVLGHKGGRVLLCDGRRRTLAAPKAKNPLHVQPVNVILPGEALASDLAVKMALKEYEKSRQAQMQGG